MSFMLRKSLSVFVIAIPTAWLLWGITSSRAANISVRPLTGDANTAHALVLVEGDLSSGDDKIFRSRVGALTKALVAFTSDGGSLLAGIEIGKVIRLKSFATVVVNGKRCASACALAWLGGTPRYMATNSFIGFHAAYVEKEGRAAETGVGNALLGSYLNQIGLSESAVIYITIRAPNEMNWLTLREAERNGIDVKLFQGAPIATSGSPVGNSPSPDAPVAPNASEVPSQSAPILPNGISAMYASLIPGQARMLTCRDQYVANKSNAGNGGLLWIQQGGGYYKECNQHLKAMGH
jgi:hypothetical protein